MFALGALSRGKFFLHAVVVGGLVSHKQFGKDVALSRGLDAKVGAECVDVLYV